MKKQEELIFPENNNEENNLEAHELEQEAIQHILSFVYRYDDNNLIKSVNEVHGINLINNDNRTKLILEIDFSKKSKTSDLFISELKIEAATYAGMIDVMLANYIQKL